jgi:hypothetical protein
VIFRPGVREWAPHNTTPLPSSAGSRHLDRPLRQREIGERPPPGGGAFHENLDFLQMAARPFLLEADELAAGLAVDLLGAAPGQPSNNPAPNR